MSTRAAIARPNGDGFLGRYHHWDGYPSGLGATLYWLAQSNDIRSAVGLPPTPWDGDVEKMLVVLLDEHTGWSTINDKDFRKSPGYQDLMGQRDEARPECYCHGTRSEEGWAVDEKNASGSGVEYTYVISPNRKMTVLSSYAEFGGERQKMIGFFGMGAENAEWQPIGYVDLDEHEPNWEAMYKSQYPEEAKA